MPDKYEVSTVQPALITGDLISIGITHPVTDNGDIKYPVMSVLVGVDDSALAFAFDRKAVDMLFRFIFDERAVLFPDGEIKS